MNATAQKWLEYAETDFLAALNLFEEGLERYAGIICFHCQQSIEKQMKALLIYHEQLAPKTHNLVEIS